MSDTFLFFDQGVTYSSQEPITLYGGTIGSYVADRPPYKNRFAGPIHLTADSDFIVVGRGLDSSELTLNGTIEDGGRGSALFKTS